MEHQFGSSMTQQYLQQQQQQQKQRQDTRPSKRRMDDDEPVVTKRYFDLNTQFSPEEAVPEKDVPAITYASPDYRPPPRAEVPLWLQPVNTANSPMTEDDSEDETVILTPYQLHQQQQQQQTQQQAFGKPAMEYWGDMMIDQWQ